MIGNWTPIQFNFTSGDLGSIRYPVLVGVDRAGHAQDCWNARVFVDHRTFLRWSHQVYSYHRNRYSSIYILTTNGSFLTRMLYVV